MDKKNFNVWLNDEVVNVVIEYLVTDVISGDVAIERAKGMACRDSDLPYSRRDRFTVVRVEETDCDSLMVV